MMRKRANKMGRVAQEQIGENKLGKGKKAEHTILNTFVHISQQGEMLLFPRPIN